jgi:hypothetical protein
MEDNLMATPQELMQIGSQLVEFCNNGQWREAQQQMYSAEAISAEAVPMPDGERISNGLEAIVAKGDWWEGAHEVHSTTAEGPFVHGEDRFNVIFDMDVTNKESGERTQMREVATYVVNDGKIVREEFAYPVG